MFFIDKKHELNFKELLLRFPAGKKDYQYRIGCYITAHPQLYEKVAKHLEETPVYWAYSIREGEIEVDLTSGEKILVDLMLNLWNGTPGFDLNHAIGVWDEENFEMFLETLRIARD